MRVWECESEHEMLCSQRTLAPDRVGAHVVGTKYSQALCLCSPCSSCDHPPTSSAGEDECSNVSSLTQQEPLGPAKTGYFRRGRKADLAKKVWKGRSSFLEMLLRSTQQRTGRKK